MLSPFPILRIFEKLWLDLAAMFEFEPSSRIFHDYGLVVMLGPSSSSYFFRGSSSRTNKGKEPVTDAPSRSTRSSNAAVQQAWEEAEVAAWIQAERAKASMESTCKSRPSIEDSGERPDFDGGEGASSSSSRRGKRRRGHCRSQRRHESSPDLEIPSTIVEEASGDDDEPPEKRSRGEETIDDEDDGSMMPEVSTDEAVKDLSWHLRKNPEILK
ncbi:hypothetical protein MRB53_034773 [Persea americana]|uniref:Uncharacterized protein n=1 Tax=Persea americana TaxID=3435 RepID=A0ACC2K2R4_PERAE|nr:hypothetical protein MRB53_034773 [Persea americana]